jgi:hypothetical protein
MKNLTAKPFKNGDRVVPSIKLWKRLEARSCTGIGSQDNPTAWFFNGEFVALGDVCYSIDKNGRLNRVDEQDLYFLHAPAFGNLKAGDDNPFVVGMPVKRTFAEGEVKGMVSDVGPGPSARVNFENGAIQWAGWYNNGRPFQGPYDINTIFPATQEQPAHAAGFEFGDKVKSDNGNSWWVVGSHSTLVFIVPREQDLACIRKGVEDEDSMLTLDIIHSSRLTPWIEPVTVKLNHEYEATVYPEHIKVGCQEFPLSIIDELVEARKKVTDHE